VIRLVLGSDLILDGLPPVSRERLWRHCWSTNLEPAPASPMVHRLDFVGEVDLSDFPPDSRDSTKRPRLNLMHHLPPRIRSPVCCRSPVGRF
jgi:hypothetical protein